jgi:hypothetical protein
MPHETCQNVANCNTVLHFEKKPSYILDICHRIAL